MTIQRNLAPARTVVNATVRRAAAGRRFVSRRVLGGLSGELQFELPIKVEIGAEVGEVIDQRVEPYGHLGILGAEPVARLHKLRPGAGMCA